MCQHSLHEIVRGVIWKTGKDPGYSSTKHASALTQRISWGNNVEDTGKDPRYPSMKMRQPSLPEIVGDVILKTPGRNLDIPQ
jgi:hypothetical protein